jgi:hypothetical protein
MVVIKTQTNYIDMAHLIIFLKRGIEFFISLLLINNMLPYQLQAAPFPRYLTNHILVGFVSSGKHLKEWYQIRRQGPFTIVRRIIATKVCEAKINQPFKGNK